MRIKDSYKVREIAGEHIIIGQGKSSADMTKVISLNASALLLWNELQGKEFSLKEATEVLTGAYGIEQERAEADAQKWIDKLMHCHVIE